LKQHPSVSDIPPLIQQFGGDFKALGLTLLRYADEETKEKLLEESERYRKAGLKKKTAVHLACLSLIPACHDIVAVAQRRKLSPPQVARLYFATGKRFHLALLRQKAGSLTNADRWEARAQASLVDDLYDLQRQITETILMACDAGDAPLSAKPEGMLQRWLADRQLRLARIDRLLGENIAARGSDLARLTVLHRALCGLLE
jgi:NAD-specific glutamate dehydrogenase